METTAALVPDPSSFIHVRVSMGMIVGLGIATILTGFARFMQHPGRYHTSWIHMLWAVSMLLSLISFWWWEQSLAAVNWRIDRYFFVMGYAILLFVMSALLFPLDTTEYSGYEDYFLSRRTWFFSMLALSMVFDATDTLLKGQGYFLALGFEYPARLAIYVALALLAASTRDLRFHGAFAVVNVLYQVAWIVRRYSLPG